MAPCLMYFIGYWALGNRQIFYDITNPIQDYGTPADPDHGLWPILWDHSVVLLGGFIFAWVMQLSGNHTVKNFIEKYVP